MHSACKEGRSVYKTTNMGVPLASPAGSNNVLSANSAAGGIVVIDSAVASSVAFGLCASHS